MNDVGGVKGPPITVLMSVYNGARWLEEAIQSVLSQTFADFELIIINDGSKDQSLDIISRFANRDRRIVVIDKPNTGLADSLNQGIKQAKGGWIARIDADDLCAPDRLQRQYALAKTDPALVLIGSGLLQIDEIGCPGKSYRYPASHKAIVGRLTTARPLFAHSSAFYKTEVVKRLGGYRPRIKRGQDLDLWLRLSETGKIACIRESLVKIRIHAGQITNDEQGQRQIIDSRVAMTSYWLRLDGFVDPVAAAYSDADFNMFREWVVKRLQQNGLFEYLAFVRKIKQQLGAEGNLLAGYLKVFASLLHEPILVFRYLCQALIGERFQRKIAAAWVKRN